MEQVKVTFEISQTGAFKLIIYEYVPNKEPIELPKPKQSTQ